MTGTLPHDAAHTLAGGGARALRDTVTEHTLRTAFASGLNGALMVLGGASVATGALVLLLVRAPHADGP